jgi:hypothetical protein
MATPRIADCGQTAPHRVDPFLPQSFNWEIAFRFIDVIAKMVNHSSAAITYIIRFVVLLPVAILLVIVEALVRLDNVIERKSAKLAEVLR